MKKYILLILALVSCGTVDPVTSETPAITSSEDGSFTETTKLRILKDENTPYYPSFERDIEYSYYSDGLIRTILYKSDDKGLFFEYIENGDKIAATIYKYAGDIDNKELAGFIDDISTTSSLVFEDTISYTNSAYTDTVITILTTPGGYTEGDYFDRYIINSKGQIDSIYHHNFGGGKLSSYEWFQYDSLGRIELDGKALNLIPNDGIKVFTIYEYKNNKIKQKLSYSYNTGNLNDENEPIINPDRIYQYNNEGLLTFIYRVWDDTILEEKCDYLNDNYLVSNKHFSDDGLIQEESIWEYDSENNLTYEKLVIMKDGTFDSEATYKYEEVEVTTKDEATYNKIMKINEMIYKSYHDFMLGR